MTTLAARGGDSSVLIPGEPASIIAIKPGTAFPVTEIRPAGAGHVQALNLVPSQGAKPFGFYGYAWLHVLDADHTRTPDFGAAQLGINETDVVLASIGFGSQEPKPITFRFDSKVAARLTPSELQVPGGRVVISRDTSGVVIDLVRKGVSKGQIVVDEAGARLEGFKRIDDLEERIRILEDQLNKIVESQNTRSIELEEGSPAP